MAGTTPTQKSESNDPSTVPDALAVDPRTRRACEQAMTVVTHGGGSSMFEVYSESDGEYTISLREPVGWTCPDFQHRKPEGGCEHVRWVRLESGIENIPSGLRSEYVAPSDVELARRHRGLNDDGESDSETKPTPVKVNSTPPVVADGGRETDHTRMVVNKLACQLAEIDRVEGFDEFCIVVEEIQWSIMRGTTKSDGRSS